MTEVKQPTVSDALELADNYMRDAQLAYAQADSKMRLESVANQIARAQYLQARALSFYQYAATFQLRG